MMHSEVAMSFRTEVEKISTELRGGSWIVLARACRSMEAYVEHSIQSLGIGMSDFIILESLMHDHCTTLSSLCRRTLLKNQSMTYAIDRLIKKNLVEHAGHWPGDRRKTLVKLTPEGKAFIEPIFARHLKDIDAIMADIPSADRAEACRILNKIAFAAEIKLKQLKTKPKAKRKKKDQ
jgi:MarR family 2-MHQ and catechol resistance regulon transcriptional repressor